MAIHYRCRHCGINLGTLDTQNIDSQKLGFHQLDQAERIEMIQYDESGNINVNAICEDCQEALERNPRFHENNNFIQ